VGNRIAVSLPEVFQSVLSGRIFNHHGDRLTATDAEGSDSLPFA
jgi:hypothetical protein